MITKDFFELVYEIARMVPKGRVTSYGAIGKYLGSARSARMVGWAMNGAPRSPRATLATSGCPKGRGPKPVPAHRVVNRNGELTGKHHFGHPNLMQQLLKKEGIKVKNDKIINFEKLFWDPAKELKL